MYNNSVDMYNNNTTTATGNDVATYSAPSGFPTYDQYVQQQVAAAAAAAQQYNTSKSDGGLVGTAATYKLQCYQQQQTVMTAGLLPLKPQEVAQQAQQTQQLQPQQLPQLIPTVSQPAAVAATSLTTAQPLFNTQIVTQHTQVSNPSQQQQGTTPVAVTTSGIYIAPPANLAPLPPPHITPEIVAAAAAAAARTIPGTDTTTPTPLLQNPLATPLQLQALPVYQPQANTLIQQSQTASTMISQQQGGGAVIQPGYVQQSILPNQLRPLQQNAGVLIQQHCYVPIPTTAAAGAATTNLQYNVVQQPILATLPPPPPVPNEEKGLPENWRTAQDPAGKIYYYHCITK